MPSKIKIICSFLFLFPILSSCDKDNINKETGQYAVTISYSGDHYIELLVEVDGEPHGSFFPTPNVVPSYTSECSDLRDPEKLTNVFVVKEVNKGKHKVELKNKNGDLVKSLEFEMMDRECVFQYFTFVAN